MPLILKTERLYLRNLCPADAQTMFAYRNDPRCYKFQRWKDTSMEAIRAFIADFQEDTFLSRKPAFLSLKSWDSTGNATPRASAPM